MPSRAIIPSIPAAAEAEPKPVDQPIPAPAPVTEPVQPPARRFGRKRDSISTAPPMPEPRSYGLLATVLVLAMLSLVVAGRETVVLHWPAAAKGFALMGLPVNLHGLEVRDVSTRIVQEPTQRVLTIDGQIRNLREGSQALPELLLSLRDKHGREIYAWKAPPPKSGIARGETIQFRARLASPPDGADVVRVQFAEPATTRTASR